MTGLGWLVLGERRYRLIERTTGDLIGSVPLGERLHRPDLLLIGGSRVIAVEVELTVKAPRRLERICRGFARARHLDGVVYFAAPRPARAVQRAVAAAGAGGAVRVYALAETDELRPPEP